MVDFPSRQKLYDSNTKFFGLDQALGVIWHLSSVISMAQKSYPVTYAINQGFQLAKTVPVKENPGIFIPFFADKFTYDYANQSTGQYKWMASGPFSGCKISIFSDKNGVGMGHIAQPSPAADAEYEEFRKREGVKVHYENKIPLPREDQNAGSYIFLDLRSKIKIITRIDLTVNGMGASNGAIYNVEPLNCKG